MSRTASVLHSVPSGVTAWNTFCPNTKVSRGSSKLINLLISLGLFAIRLSPPRAVLLKFMRCKKTIGSSSLCSQIGELKEGFSLVALYLTWCKPIIISLLVSSMFVLNANSLSKRTIFSINELCKNSSVILLKFLIFPPSS